MSRCKEDMATHDQWPHLATVKQVREGRRCIAIPTTDSQLWMLEELDSAIIMPNVIGGAIMMAGLWALHFKLGYNVCAWQVVLWMWSVPVLTTVVCVNRLVDVVLKIERHIAGMIDCLDQEAARIVAGKYAFVRLAGDPPVGHHLRRLLGNPEVHSITIAMCPPGYRRGMLAVRAIFCRCYGAVFLVFTFALYWLPLFTLL